MKTYHFSEDAARELLVANYRSQCLVPFFGAGFTKGMRCNRGRRVPDGNELSQILKDILSSKSEELKSEVEEIHDLKSLFQLFENDEIISESERKNTLLNLFSNVELNKARGNLINLLWRNIVTLNIDDAIEKKADKSYSKITPHDNISMERVKNRKNIIKLHGCITEYDKCSDGRLIFTWKSYVNSISKNSSILNYLENLATEQSFIFIGCSLDGEIDLIPIGLTGRLEKSIYVTKGKPTLHMRLKLDQYNIGHVIYFDSYEQIYEEIYKILSEVDIQESITEMPIEEIPKLNDVSGTAIHIANGGPHHKIIEHNGSSYEAILKPEYGIYRDVTQEICQSVFSTKIIAITGRRFSGKTTILIHLYEKIKQYQTYIFMSHHPYNESLLRLIRSVEGALFMFDTNYIPKSMMRDVVREISKSKNKAIFVFNNHDKDSLIEATSDSNVDSQQYEIKPKFSSEERQEFNRQMNSVGIQTMKPDNTILTFAYNTYEANKANTGSSSLFDFKTINEHAFKLLTLTELESKLDSDIISKCLGGFVDIQRLIADSNLIFDVEWHGGMRYIVCNSSQIALRVLSDFAKKDMDSAADLISKLATDLKNGDYLETADKIINFDFLNATFSWEGRGNARLIKLIYERLASSFGQQNHYWLQRAKCELRSAEKISDIENGIIWANKVKRENSYSKNKTYYSATLTIAQLYGKKVVLASKMKIAIDRDMLNGMIDNYQESASNYENNKGYLDDISRKYREGKGEIAQSFEIILQSAVSLERIQDIRSLTTFLSNRNTRKPR